jgi:hypothetical protein
MTIVYRRKPTINNRADLVSILRQIGDVRDRNPAERSPVAPARQLKATIKASVKNIHRLILSQKEGWCARKRDSTSHKFADTNPSATVLGLTF